MDSGNENALCVPGWGVHRLQGEPVRFALSVNGPWRITFEWEDGNALRVIAGGAQNFPRKDGSLYDIFTVNQLIDVFKLYPDAERAVTALQNEET